MSNTEWLLFLDIDHKPLNIEEFSNRMMLLSYFGEVIEVLVYDTNKGYHIFIRLRPFNVYADDSTLQYLLESVLMTDPSVVVWRYIRDKIAGIKDIDIEGNKHIKKRGEDIIYVNAKRNEILEEMIVIAFEAKMKKNIRIV